MVVPEKVRLETVMSIETGSKNTENKVDGAKYPFFVRSQIVERIADYSYDCEAVLTAGDGVGTGKVFHYIKGKFDAHQRVYVMSQFNGIDGKYFFYYFSRYFFDEVTKYTAKSSVDSVRRAMIADMEIPLPPLPEQRLIAEALTDTDALISALEKLIDKKRAIKQGTMQELLTGKHRLDGFSGEWNYTDISSEFDLFAGGDLDKENFSSSKTNVFRYSIFANALQYDGLYGYTSVPKYKGDSITITGRGDVGTAMYRRYPFDAIVRLLVLSPKTNNTVDSRFVTYLINTCIKFPFESTGVPQLTVPQIKNVELFLPPKPEQTAIAQVLCDMDGEIDALTTKLDKLRNIKQGMMSELLTGRIRLLEEV